MVVKRHTLSDREIIGQAVVDSLKKVNPLSLWRNPVMFVTEVGAAITTVGLVFGSEKEPSGFVLQVTLWLWFTVLFAGFAEAMAEGRGKAQARTLRQARHEIEAHVLEAMAAAENFDPAAARTRAAASSDLRTGQRGL